MYKIGGNIIHSRAAHPNNKQFGRKSRDIDLSNAEKILAIPKFKYLMPLNKTEKKKLEILRKIYPKRDNLVEGQQIPSVGGGATPTLSLQKLNDKPDKS